MINRRSLPLLGSLIAVVSSGCETQPQMQETAAAAPPASAEARAAIEPDPSPTTVARSGSPAVARLVSAADTIVLATLVAIDNRAVKPDGLRSTLVFEVDESLKGSAGPRLNLRFPAGYNPDGTAAQVTDGVEVLAQKPGAIRPGERFLLFTSRSAYEQRARAHGRVPEKDATQALEILRVKAGEAQGFGMNPLYLRLIDLRHFLEAHRG